MLKVETKVYPPHGGLCGLPPSLDSVEASSAWPHSGDVFLSAADFPHLTLAQVEAEAVHRVRALPPRWAEPVVP